MDVVILSRIQFALTVGFHFFYPPMSIGLGLMLVIFEGIYLKTKNPIYKQIAKFWGKIFGLTFAMGVATGLVQVFAFGNNWAHYSRFVGDVFGSALAAEGVFAFTLEAGFLGLMLFGWERVKPGLHYLSTILVTLGAHFSAIWIIVANSWMQTPAGYKVIGEGDEARAVITDFWQLIFNPSFLDRITHVILACWLTGAFLILSVSAFYYLKQKHGPFAQRTMKVGLTVAGIVILLQLVSADATARGVAKNQPEKLAAIEGVFKTQDYTPMGIIGFPDVKEQKVKGITVPGLLSFLTFRQFKKPVTGLDQFDKADWPNVRAVFQTYHIMIYMWFAMFVTALFGCIHWWRKSLVKAKWTLRVMIASVVFPQIANETGWFTAEMGRQPWVVYHVLRTVDGVSRSIVAGQVVGSIIMFIVIYTLLFCVFIYLMNHKIQHGPEEIEGLDEAVYRDPYSRAKGV